MRKFIFCTIFSFYISLQSHPSFFTTTIPKSGTYLLRKLITLSTGRLAIFNTDDFLTLPQLALQDQNYFFCTHAMASQHNINISTQSESKGIFMYRDPRDQIISFMHYVYQQTAWPHLMHLDEKELISRLIQKGRSIYNGRTWHNSILFELDSIVDFYYLYLPWKEYDHIYTTTFEKLVGSQGGGSDEVQLHEVKAIFKHLEIEMNDERIISIASQLFGHSGTFRSGQIGSWKQHFTEYHKALFKSIAGELLIELGYEQDYEW